jgi:hypothetical protein
LAEQKRRKKVIRNVINLHQKQFTDRAVVVVTTNHLTIRDLMTQAVGWFVGLLGRRQLNQNSFERQFETYINWHVENIAWMGREVTFNWRFLNFDVFLEKFKRFSLFSSFQSEFE